MIQPYTADDRGDRVDFYYTNEDGEAEDHAAQLTREGGDTGDQLEWDGGGPETELFKWAIANGYPEVAEAKQI
jgi:hypothetical protein